MKTPPFEPVRILDQHPQEAPAEVAHLIRQAIGAPDKVLPPLKGRIRQTLRRRSASRRRHLRTILVGGAIFISGGVVGAVVQPILRLRAQAKVESVESITPVPSARRTHPGRLPSRPTTVIDPGELGTETPLPAPPWVPSEPSQETRPSPFETASSPPVSAAEPPAPAAAFASAQAQAGRPVRERPAQASQKLVPSANAGERSATPARAGDLQIAMREPPTESSLSPPRVSLDPEPWQPTSAADTGTRSGLAPLPGEDEAPSPRRSSALAAPVAAWPGSVPDAPRPAAGPPPSEQSLLASAIRSLRVQHSPGTALEVLSHYQSRYPKGSMLAEAARLRAEALLLLGQRRAALDELSREPVAGTATDEESRLVRGELRATEGRWQEALRDFDALVATWRARGPRGEAGMSPKLSGRFERALWGRACARSQLGDEQGARADLQDLLRGFPQGRFASQAASRLVDVR